MTDQVFYDNDLTDNYGLSSTAGITVTIPLTGASFNIKLADALTQLADTEANGGAGVSFANNNATGSASVTVNHDASKVLVTLNDALGRTVLNGQLKGPTATNPSEPMNWSCIGNDNAVTITGYGDVLETHSIDMDGNIAKSRLDHGGRTMESEDVLGNIAKSVYKPNGNLIKSYDRMNKLTSYSYDNLSRSTSSTNPINATVSTTYDTEGNVVSTTDAKSNSASFGFDVLGRLVSETDRTGATTSYSYDLNGNPTLQTDAEGKVTAWTHNEVGQRVSMTYSDAGVLSVTYDPAGAGLTQTMPSGRILSYTSNSFLSLVTQIEYKDPAGTTTNSEVYAFDDMGRQTSVSSSKYSVSSGRTYDGYGRLDSETTTYSGQTYTVSYGYNDRSQRISLTYPSGDVAEYGYDNRQLLDTISWESNQLEDRDYNANGLLTSVDRAFEDETRVYDDASRLTAISSTNTGSMTYIYDANNNVMSETLSGVMSNYSFTTEKPGAGTYADGYDGENRFMRYIRAGVSEDILLGRSGIGNISSSTLNGGSPTNRTYDNAHAMNSFGSATQTYDADGNATTLHTGVTVDWDNAGHVEATHVSSTATAGIAGDNTYGYLDGKMVWRKITRGGNVHSHEVYVYSGSNRIAEYNTVGTPLPKVQRIFGDVIDSFAYHVGDSGDILIPVKNRQWSIASLVRNTTGAVVERYSYDANGKRTIYGADGATVRAVSDYSNCYGYTSREHLIESGLCNLRARLFDCHTGEFISKDLLSFIDGMSVYRGYFILQGVDPNGTNHERPIGDVNPIDRKIPCYKCTIDQDCITLVNSSLCFLRRYIARVMDWDRDVNKDRRKYDEHISKIPYWQNGVFSQTNAYRRWLETAWDLFKPIANHHNEILKAKANAITCFNMALIKCACPGCPTVPKLVFRPVPALPKSPLLVRYVPRRSPWRWPEFSPPSPGVVLVAAVIVVGGVAIVASGGTATPFVATAGACAVGVLAADIGNGGETYYGDGRQTL